MRKIISLLLALCLVVGMMPVAASAAEGDQSNLTPITADTKDLISGNYVLNDDITLSNGPLTVKSGSTVTLTLNEECTLTNATGQHTIVVENGGNLTISGSGTVDNVSHGKAALVNNGITVINGGTFLRSKEDGTGPYDKPSNSYYTVENYGNMTINSPAVLINSGSYSSMLHNGWASTPADTNVTAIMTINGGTFFGGLNTVKNDECAKLTIKNGNFTNTTSSGTVIQNWNIAEIDGGTFTSAGSTIANGFYKATSSVGNLTINGGNFTTDDDNKSLISYGSGASTGGLLAISGGTFNGTLVASPDTYDLTVSGGTITGGVQNRGVDVTITGTAKIDGIVSNTGTGKTEVTENAKIGSVSGTVTVAETVEVTNQENGTSEAKIGTQYYATLEEAIDQASEGATIVMLKDAVFEKGILVTKKITLDMAGHSITAPSGTSIWQDADPQKPSEEDRWSFLSVRENGDLTVTGKGKIEANENDCYAIDVQKGGKCTIENGTFIGNISAVYLIDGSVSIKGGTFDIKQTYKPDDPYALLININDQAAEKPENSIVITGGTFKGDVSEFLAEGLVWDEATGQVKRENPEEPSTPVTPTTPTYANTVSDTENGKVTASPTRPKEGATVTITTTPDKGYEVGSVSVTDADGKAVAVTNAGNGKYTFKQPDSKVTIKVTFVWDNPFTDVKSTAWYYNAVKYVYENNLMAGTGDTTFDPEVSLTRAMTAQILYNLEGQPKVDEEATFSDMTEAPTWSVDAIAWAQDTGVVAGMGDNEFAPNAKVTREQFAQMMYNYAKYKKYDLTKTGDLSKFPDDGSVSDWAETAMSWANGNGLINGHEDSGLIDPAGNTIRGQAASIIMNFDLNVVK